MSLKPACSANVLEVVIFLLLMLLMKRFLQWSSPVMVVSTESRMGIEEAEDEGLSNSALLALAVGLAGRGEKVPWAYGGLSTRTFCNSEVDSVGGKVCGRVRVVLTARGVSRPPFSSGSGVGVASGVASSRVLMYSDSPPIEAAKEAAPGDWTGGEPIV